MLPHVRERAVTPRSAGRPVGALALPFLAEGDYLLVAAADEVPPHDDLLTEWLTPQDEDPRRLRRARLERNRRGARGLEHDLARLGHGAAHGQVAGVAQESVLVAASSLTSSDCPAARVTSAPTRAEYIGTGDVCPNRLPRKTRTFAPSTSVTGGS